MRSLPFTPDVFLSLFETYNQDIWPMQVAAYALGIAALLLALRPLAGAGWIAPAALAALWLWNGIAYHWMYFLQINFAALGFGALFVLQGLLLAMSAALGRPSFRFRPGLAGWAGLSLALFALAGYPIAGSLAGHVWPRAPVFGVAPCPTTIFTFGLLLMAEGRAPVLLAAIPFLWAMFGGVGAVVLLGVPEDASLVLAGVIGMGLLVAQRRRNPAAPG